MTLTLAWTLVAAAAGEFQEFRVAAINFTADGSKVLVEDASGEQRWFEVGDNLGPAEIIHIDKDSVTLSEAGEQSVIMLRRSGRAAKVVRDEVIEPAREQSKTFQYVGLISELEANDVRPGESQAVSDARVMNRALGLAEKAKITAIDRVEVSTAAEARSELQQRLMSSDPVRISVEGDALEVLYVVPN